CSRLKLSLICSSRAHLREYKRIREFICRHSRHSRGEDDSELCGSPRSNRMPARLMERCLKSRMPPRWMETILTLIFVGIVSPASSADLECKPEVLGNGTHHFSTPLMDSFKASDCEIQWFVNGTVIGHIKPGEKGAFMEPVLNLTENTATLRTCPPNLEYKVICTNANHSQTKCLCPDKNSQEHPKDQPNDPRVIVIAIGVVIVIVVVIAIVVVIGVVIVRKTR
ncbi:hypothetical protein DNTS_020250, partial [Danionella cerebrum]